MIILASLDDRKESGDIPLEEASEDIERTLMSEKKKFVAATIIEEMMADYASYESLKEFAEAIDYELFPSPEFSRSMGLPQIGRGNAFIGAAFGLPVGSKSELIEVNNNFYLLEVVERIEAEMENFEKSREAVVTQMRNLMMQSIYSQFSEELFDKTKIEDLRRLPAPDSLSQAQM